MDLVERIREIEDMLSIHHNIPLISGLSRNEVCLMQRELRVLKVEKEYK